MLIDVSRHSQIFDALKWQPKTSCLIGAGAVGSRMALHLAELDIPPLDIFDDDTVESHNIANQAYNVGEIGNYKALALMKAIDAKLGFENLKVHPSILRIVKHRLPHQMILCCVDTMEARKSIFNQSILRGEDIATTTELFVDTRMDATSVMVYLLDPRVKDQVERYREMLYTSQEVNEGRGGCQITQSVGCTAQMAASIATARIIDWLMGRQYVFESLFDWRNNTLSTQLV